MAESPYGTICNLRKKGEVIPFLSAGTCLNGRQPKATWEEKSALFLPMGEGRAALFAEEAMFPSTDPHDREDLAEFGSFRYRAYASLAPAERQGEGARQAWLLAIVAGQWC